MDSMHGPWRRLERLQGDLERTGASRVLDLIREHPRDPDTRDGCIDGGFRRGDGEPRRHRDGPHPLPALEVPGARRTQGLEGDAIVAAEVIGSPRASAGGE